MNIDFRGIETEEDRNFILHNWRTSFRESYFGKTLSLSVYNELQNQKMYAALDSGEALLAHVAEDPDTLLGFLVHATNPYGLSVVHYCYTKKLSWVRGKGIARKMLAHIQKPNPELSIPVIFNDVTKDFFELRKAHDLPYVTAREWDDFTNDNPDSPQAEFAEWFRDQCFRWEHFRRKEAERELKRFQEGNP